MRNLLLVLSVCVSAWGASAQNFAPVGAEWCYYEHSENYIETSAYHHYYKVEKDTIINDTVCAAVSWKKWDENEILRANGTAYLYREAHRVYIRVSGEFVPLYDFSLLPGDSLHAQLDEEKEYLLDFPVYRMDIGEKVNGIGYKISEDSTALGNNFNWGFYGKISDVFGSYESLFGVSQSVILTDGNYYTQIKGYKDSLFQYGSLQACKTILSEGVNTGDDKQVIVSSQPGAKVHIAVPQDFGVYEATVLDMSGRVLKKAPSLSGSSTIALPGIAPGMYVVRVMSASGDSAGYMVWLD